MKKFFYLALVIMYIWVILNASKLYPFSKKVELINLTNIEQIEILILATNTTTYIKSNSDIKELSSLFNQLNSNDRGGRYNGEDEVLYHIYIHNKGYYPGSPISVCEDKMRYQNEYVNLSQEELSKISSVLDDNL